MNNEFPKLLIDKWQLTVDLIAELFAVQYVSLTIFGSNSNEKLFVHSNTCDANNDTDFRAESIMDYALFIINQESPLEVPNAIASEEWNNSAGIRFNLINYLGYPIFDKSNHIFAVLSLQDTFERHYTQKQKSLLKHIISLIQNDFFLCNSRNEQLGIYKHLLINTNEVKKDNYLKGVSLTLIKRLMMLKSLTPNKRYLKQIDELIEQLCSLPYTTKDLDLGKLLRYLIPIEKSSEIVVRFKDIDGKLAFNTPMATEIIVRLIVIYILLENIHASIAIEISNSHILFSVLITICDTCLDDFEKDIKEPIKSFAEKFNGETRFDLLDDLIYKMKISMPLEMQKG